MRKLPVLFILANPGNPLRLNAHWSTHQPSLSPFQANQNGVPVTIIFWELSSRKGY